MFEYLDKAGCGTINLAAIVAAPEAWLSELDEDVRGRGGGGVAGRATEDGWQPMGAASTPLFDAQTPPGWPTADRAPTAQPFGCIYRLADA